MKQLLFLFFLIPITFASAQIEVIFKNPKPIDENRYNDIKGSSMLFDDWTNATLYDNKGMSYENIAVNYNGESNFLEAKKNDKEYIDVDIADIPRVVVSDPADTGFKELAFLDSLVLVHGPNLKSKSTFHVLLFRDKKRMLFLEYHAALSTVIDRPPGQIIERKRFNKKYKLVLLEGATVKRFFINQKKDIDKNLKPYGSYLKWSKSKKLKPNKYETLMAFLEKNK